MNPRLKIELAQSASGVGAFILGIGVGVSFLDFFSSSRYVLLALGIAMHGWGMMTLANTKDENGKHLFYTNHLLRMLMWLCAVALVILIASLLNRLA